MPLLRSEVELLDKLIDAKLNVASFACHVALNDKSLTVESGQKLIELQTFVEELKTRLTR